jgi:histone acetyltransferase
MEKTLPLDKHNSVSSIDSHHIDDQTPSLLDMHDTNETESIESEVSVDQSLELKKPPSIAVLDEKEGAVEFKVVSNDKCPESMILLTGLKNIFQRQLPKMPKEYISRLAYDMTHVAMAVVRHPLNVVG